MRSPFLSKPAAILVALLSLIVGCQGHFDPPQPAPQKLGAVATQAIANGVEVYGVATDNSAFLPMPIAVNGLTVPVTVTGSATVDNSALTQPTASSAVTPSDSTVLACGKGLWIGTAGNLSLKLSSDSSAQTWKNVPSGSFTPGNIIRVMVATTAADIVCLN